MKPTQAGRPDEESERQLESTGPTPPGTTPRRIERVAGAYGHFTLHLRSMARDTARLLRAITVVIGSLVALILALQAALHALG